jgi:hypothetical protein
MIRKVNVDDPNKGSLKTEIKTQKSFLINLSNHDEATTTMPTAANTNAPLGIAAIDEPRVHLSTQ